MEDLQEEIQRIRHAGMERAAAIWESLASLADPISPVDIYKATAAMKCTEFARAARAHQNAITFLTLITQFFADSMTLVNDDGDAYQGARALRIIEEAMPMTDEIYNDPSAYAERQHTFEGLLLLSAAGFGKEAEFKKCHDHLHLAVGRLVLQSYGVDPDAEPQA